MAYGKYRHSTIYGEKGSIWNVEIWKDSFSGSSAEINLSGEGFEITWNGQGGTRDRVFLGSECKLNCLVENNIDESFLYDTIDSGYKEYFIRIYRGTVSNDNLWWYGFVQPAFDALENAPYPYVYQLTATDSYGFYNKKKEETFADDAERNTPHMIRNILFSFITDMSLNVGPIPTAFTWCRTSVDWYREGETNTTSDPFVLYLAAKGFVTDSNNADEEISPTALRYKASDVFNGVLKAFNTVGFLAEGHYNFIQPNNYANNTTGEITAFEYHSGLVSNPDNPLTINTLLTIDQSNHVILGGSTISYEPSFESVTVNYNGGFSNFDISPGQQLHNEFYAGSLQSGLDGLLNLSFNAQYYERVNESFNTSGTGYDVSDSTYTTTGQLKIRITDGTTNKYLVQTAGSNLLTWASSESPITVLRGLGISSALPVNSTSYMAIGPVSNVYGQSGGPCDMTGGIGVGQTGYKFYTDILFNANVEQPPISGDVYIEFDCGNYYFQRNLSSGNVIVLAGSQPTLSETSIECVDITLSSIDYNQENNVTDGITYTANQTNNDAIEQFDLGDVKLGASELNNLSSIQYNSGTSGSPFYEVASTFRRGNSGSYVNPSLLLVTEFLEFQVEPLEILQADIQSADISPLKLIKYSINNDTNFKYYSFLGGTFKGQSEILSGEWFKVNSIETGMVPDQYQSAERAAPSVPPIQQELFQKNLIERNLLNDNSYGSLNADLATGTSSDKLVLSAASKGKIYNGQKLLLSYADGSNPLVLTASADASTSDTQISLSSFTLGTKYPAGSILRPLLYDFTNVITGGGGSTSPGGSDTQVQFNDSSAFGGDSGLTYNKTTDTLTTVNLAVQDIDVTGSSNALTVNCDDGNVGIYVISTDSVASIRFEDNGTNDVILAGAEGDDFIIRSDDGGFKVKTQENAVTALELSSDGNLKAHNIGNIYDTEAYLTAVDFCMSTDRSKSAHSRSDGAASRIDSSIASTFATFQVPLGYQATHVLVSGSSTSSTFDVYESDCDSSSTTSLTSSPAVGTNTALSSASTGGLGKYLVIKFTPGATTRDVYGAKITLARV